MTEYEPSIGLETHAQLLTASKMFCSCSTGYQAAPPNSFVCPVCLGMPGSLPVINRRAVEYVLLTALALHCRIPDVSRFDRKNYNYPDLVKGYQISQYDSPLGRDGWMEVRVADQVKRIGIWDVHLEEDTGKLLHVDGQSLIDFNRSGVPLMEIVSAPDFSSLDEVREYVLELRRILRYLGVSSGNMEEGAMRFEANVSLHPAGTLQMGTRVEVKNLNSFRAMLRSVEYEISRQRDVLQSGGKVRRETRGWDEEQGITFVQRGKEQAEDYRYFPEPDLPPLALSPDWVAEIKSRVLELPAARLQRFVTEYGLSWYDAGLLAEDRAIADYFESAVGIARPRGLEPKAVANWITGEVFRLLRAANLEIGRLSLPPQELVELVAMVQQGLITVSSAKHALGLMVNTGKRAAEIVAEGGLAQIGDRQTISALVEEVIAANPDAVAQYRSGKEPVLRFLVGQVMKSTQGKADPNLAAELLRQKLKR